MKSKITIIILIVASAFSFAQKKKKDTIDTQVINVVRPYSPTVSDAFKIKKNPSIKDSVSKKEVKYSIFSVPVASTFTPAKGKAKVLQIDPSPPYYTNFVSAALGLRKTGAAEAFVKSSSNRYNEFGGYLNFLASNGTIKDIQLDTDFLDTKLNLFYTQKERNYDWILDGGFQYQKQNWYGLSEEISYSAAAIDAINEKQNYTEVFLNGRINYFKPYFKGAEVKTHLFTDSYKSKEYHLLALPKLEFPVGDDNVEVVGRFEFLNGKFEQNFDATRERDYTYFNVGINPNFKISRDRFEVNIGGEVLFSAGSGSENDSKFYIYPKVTGSYVLIDQILTTYGGITGGLQQNTYRDFVEENLFVSPTLLVKRTNNQYNAFLGFRGKLASNISYNLKGGYTKEADKPLYKLNPSKIHTTEIVERGYEAGNSFQVVYDDVKTICGFGEIAIDFSETLNFGGNVTFNSYNTTTQTEAWNLPQLKATAFAKFNKNNWFAGAELFFVSNRNDQVTFLVPNSTFDAINIDNGSYIDLNLRGGKHITGKLSAYAKVNNLLGSNYQKYTNFRVQGIQVLAGLTYRFDF